MKMCNYAAARDKQSVQDLVRQGSLEPLEEGAHREAGRCYCNTRKIFDKNIKNVSYK